MEKEKLCLRCMRKIGNNTVCPYCSKDNSEPQKDPYLPLKTVVGGRYLIGKVVSVNGEGFTYNAFDLEEKRPVSLRELYPKGMLSRGEGNYCLVNVGKASEFIDCKDAFLKLWKKLASLTGFTALTPAQDVFEDLGTVYAVTEFLGEGQTLREFLLEKEQGYISWDEARVLFMPVISALDALHVSGIIHGGISPTTLVIDTRGKIRITGYSIPEIRTEKSTLGSELFDGYAAVEQYGFSSGIGTYTDIYAFAAVLYRTLIGSTPISASSRLTNDKLMIPGKFAEQLPAYVINALVNALQILPGDRTATAEQLRDELSASPAAAGTAAEAYSQTFEPFNEEPEEVSDVPPLLDENDDEEVQTADDKNKLKKSTIAAFSISVVICLAVLIGAVIGLSGIGKNNDDTTTTSSSDVTDETTTSESTTENKQVESLKLPDFSGKVYDKIKNDEKYSAVLIFKTEYIDSDQKRGTVVSQSIVAGTLVTSINPKTITLSISNGRTVPDVTNKDVDEAVNELKAAGFKNVKRESAKVAINESESKKVYSIAFEDEKTGSWAEIPNDRRLSVSSTIIVYYYGEFAESTEATTAPTTEATTAETTVEATEATTAETTEATTLDIAAGITEEVN